ncbi:SGT1 and CS domain containing protein [Drechmeria coniospora]|uniref:SGT1 and CS domain containing protein n=1 Tax=Drechmeria coniospora TaxID=98403 RepID=A0A151GX50_DRECN|nr:SGT1 and CS domain containing protein [Drechmeria coniospora]KYK61684.1 SGT1 and CS domain containing protein [Drechmeria coniospora]
MSHITLAQQGLAAVEAQKWEEGLGKLSRALQSSSNPAWLIARSKALIHLKRFQEALDDGDRAWHAAYERNKRPLMVEAHYRRAVAYFRLGQHANADCCCIYAMRLIKGSSAVEKADPKDANVDDRGYWTPTLQDAMEEGKADSYNQSDRVGDMSLGMKREGSQAQVGEWRLASTLRMQILRAMESLPQEDEARRPTTTLVPEKKAPAGIVHALTKAEQMKAEEKKAAAATAPTAAKPAVPSDTPLRVQEFQSNVDMSVSIFSKGNTNEKLTVSFLPAAVELDHIVYPSGQEKPFRLDLWGEIDAAKSGYTVTPNKVELRLAKKMAGKWPQLRKEENREAGGPTQGKQAGSSSSAVAANPSTVDSSKATVGGAVDQGAAHAYPSSHRQKVAKDWEKIEAEDEEEGKDVNDFFRTLYKGATPDQQRAMKKSFLESNGTSLSTDWNDVKSREVQVVPPRGVEPKKWSQ